MWLREGVAWFSSGGSGSVQGAGWLSSGCSVVQLGCCVARYRVRRGSVEGCGVALLRVQRGSVDRLGHEGAV